MSSDFYIARLVLGEQQGLCNIFSAPRSNRLLSYGRDDGLTHSPGVLYVEVAAPRIGPRAGHADIATAGGRKGSDENEGSFSA